jgi:hypothetical protein
MRELINEKVSVLTVYDRMKGTVTPWRLKWQGRRYTITKVGFHHTVRQDRKLLHYFSVTDGNLDFRLHCDTDTLHWTLEEVSDGLAS